MIRRGFVHFRQRMRHDEGTAVGQSDIFGFQWIETDQHRLERDNDQRTKRKKNVLNHVELSMTLLDPFHLSQTEVERSDRMELN